MQVKRKFHGDSHKSREGQSEETVMATCTYHVHLHKETLFYMYRCGRPHRWMFEAIHHVRPRDCLPALLWSLMGSLEDKDLKMPIEIELSFSATFEPSGQQIWL